MSEQARSYDEKDLIIFEEGLFGFEDCRKFIPLPMEGIDDFISLLSVEEEYLSFVLVNPFLVKKDYNPQLSKEDYKKLGTESEENLSYYSICVIKEVAKDSTINLKSPIVVNVATRKAIQTILNDDQYGFRHSISELIGGEA